LTQKAPSGTLIGPFVKDLPRSLWCGMSQGSHLNTANLLIIDEKSLDLLEQFRIHTFDSFDFGIKQ